MQRTLPGESNTSCQHEARSDVSRWAPATALSTVTVDVRYVWNGMLRSWKTDFGSFLYMYTRTETRNKIFLRSYTCHSARRAPSEALTSARMLDATADRTTACAAHAACIVCSHPHRGEAAFISGLTPHVAIQDGLRYSRREHSPQVRGG